MAFLFSRSFLYRSITPLSI